MVIKWFSLQKIFRNSFTRLISGFVPAVGKSHSAIVYAVQSDGANMQPCDTQHNDTQTNDTGRKNAHNDTQQNERNALLGPVS